MGKLILSIIVGALVMVAAGKWESGDLSAGQLMAAVHDTGQSLIQVQR